MTDRARLDRLTVAELRALARKLRAEGDDHMKHAAELERYAGEVEQRQQSKGGSH
jgi:hypothetical protein